MSSKRKLAPPKRGREGTERKSKKPTNWDEEILSSDDDDQVFTNKKSGDFLAKEGPSNGMKDNEDDDDFLDLPAEERRLRVAKNYLEDLGLLDEDAPSGDISEALPPSFYTPILDPPQSYSNIPTLSNIGSIEFQPNVFKRGHKASATSIAIPPHYQNQPQTDILYSAAKDSSIIRWDLNANRKLVCIEKATNPEYGPTKDILSLCCGIEEFQHLLCSGGTDNVIHVWDCRLLGSKSGLIATLKGHRGSITGIIAEPRSEFDQLITTSLDNTVKLWSLRTLSYINTLYGHTGGILSVDISTNNRPLTVAEDGSARLWKIREETHFIFKHPLCPIDTCTMLNKQYFVTGNQEGTITLWNFNNRKPLFTQLKAHNGWITALSAIPNSDLLISGSYDGYIKFWWAHRIEESPKKKSTILVELTKQRISVEGCVSQIQVHGSLVGSKYHGSLYLAIGKEQRLGRWINANGKPGIVIIPFTCDMRHRENDIEENE